MQGMHCHTPMEDVIETPVFSGRSLVGLPIPLIRLKYLADIEKFVPRLEQSVLIQKESAERK